MSSGYAEPMKIVFVNTQYVETDAASFKSVVQTLTGKDAKVGVEVPKNIRGECGGGRSGDGCGSGGAGSGSVLSRGVSFKEFDRMLMELQPLDELSRLWA